MIRFVDFPADARTSVEISGRRLNVAVERDCVLTPRRMDHATHSYSGCAYDRDGQAIAAAKRHAPRAIYQPTDPERIGGSDLPDGATVPGLSLYLGNLFNHFGHFLLETLSRAWLPRERVAACDSIVLHPWNDDHAKFQGWEVADFCFPALGIDAAKIRIVPAGGLRLERCLFPEASTVINESANRAYAGVLDRLVDAAGSHVAPETRDRYRNQRVYLTRRHQWRRPRNEDEIERALAERGFLVVAPETLPFAEQVRLGAEASVLAGADGSAMHLAMFSRNASVVTFDQRAVENQYVIERLRGLDATHIWSANGEGVDDWTIDVDKALAHVAEVERLQAA